MGRCRIIAVAGGTASGKTTLAKDLYRIGGANRVQVIPLDAYYLHQPHLPFEQRALQNYDHPDAFEAGLLRRHLDLLQSGQQIDIPVYEFAQHLRAQDKKQSISPTDVVIVEGILALHYPELRDAYSYSIFVDAPDQLRFDRRLRRDVSERGRTKESVLQQWNDTVHPMHVQFCAPTKGFASEVVSGEAWDDRMVSELWARIVAALE